MDDSYVAETPIGSAPPPPPEVKVRTMRSDIESMTRSGGGLPRFESVKVTGLSADGNQSKTSELTSDETKRKALFTAVVIVAIIALLAVAYFAYTIYFGGAL